MALSVIRVSVRWPDKRDVTVAVGVYKVHPAVVPTEEGDQVERVERVVAIDDADLADEKTLRAFLGDLTRREPSGGVVDAVILEPDVDRFLTLLGQPSGPPSDPVVVEMEGNA